jgi:hypothetical protein
VSAHEPPDPQNRQQGTATRRRRWVTPVAMAGAALVLTAGCAAATPSASPAASSTTATSPAAPSGHGRPGGGSAGGGSNARSGPAAGGTVGTVGTVSTTGLTLTTPAGQQVTVTAGSATAYVKGTSSTTASAVAKGDDVLVLGTTTGTTIAATQVTVQPAGSGSTSSASAVAPFQRGAPSAAKQDGRVPANYTEGSGTIVSGTTADEATEAALAAYPGGVVDRVVKLSNGEFEVHYIGVNWPHHIFVSKTFTVVGAN